MMLFNLILMILVIVVLLFVFYHISSKTIKMERREMDASYHTLEIYYAKMHADYEKTDREVHEINRERLYLLQALENHKEEEALQYLRHVTEEGRKKKIWTGIFWLDFLLNAKRQKIEGLGIQIQTQADIARIPITEIDGCILLGNLLDNAIRAASECEEGNRRICLEIQHKNGMVVVIMKNTSCRRPQVIGVKLPSSKRDSIHHGWGLQNVKYVVEKNDGKMTLDYTEKYFCVKILLEDRSMDSIQEGKSIQ